jgi:hypothetical protein
VKLDIKDERTGLTVADELLLDPEPYGEGHRCRCGGDLDEVRGDCAVEPGTDNAVHLPPTRVGGDFWGDIREDMIEELILAECVEEEGLPSIVVQQKIVEVDRDHRLDIEDGDGLSVKGSDRGVGLSGGVCPEDIVVVRRGWRHDGRLLGR